jgi:hypothetical protein
MFVTLKFSQSIKGIPLRPSLGRESHSSPTKSWPSHAGQLPQCLCLGRTAPEQKDLRARPNRPHTVKRSHRVQVYGVRLRWRITPPMPTFTPAATNQLGSGITDSALPLRTPHGRQ